MLRPVELEIELFCLGMRMDPSSHAGEVGRRIARTRAGLGSGLEILIPSPRKDIWMNVPVLEPFAAKSPYLMTESDGKFYVVDERTDDSYAVSIPPEPKWYSRLTTGGTEMYANRRASGQLRRDLRLEPLPLLALTPAAAREP